MLPGAFFEVADLLGRDGMAAAERSGRAVARVPAVFAFDVEPSLLSFVSPGFRADTFSALPAIGFFEAGLVVFLLAAAVVDFAEPALGPVPVAVDTGFRFFAVFAAAGLLAAIRPAGDDVLRVFGGLVFPEDVLAGSFAFALAGACVVVRVCPFSADRFEALACFALISTEAFAAVAVRDLDLAGAADFLTAADLFARTEPPPPPFVFVPAATHYPPI